MSVLTIPGRGVLHPGHAILLPAAPYPSTALADDAGNALADDAGLLLLDA